MSELIKIKKINDKHGMQTQYALYTTGYSFQIYRWKEVDGTNILVEELSYEGLADRRAARAMIMGTLDSLYQQTLNEIHGDRYTDKRGITWFWSECLGCYVTLPEDDE